MQQGGEEEAGMALLQKQNRQEVRQQGGEAIKITIWAAPRSLPLPGPPWGEGEKVMFSKEEVYKFQCLPSPEHTAWD